MEDRFATLFLHFWRWRIQDILFKGIAAKLPMPNGGKGFRIQCWILIITGYGTALFGAMEYMGPLAAVVAAVGAPAGIVCSVLLIYSLFAVEMMAKILTKFRKV